MDILPIKFISDVDKPIVGDDIYNLAQLQRSELPVPPGIVLASPKIVLNTVLKHIETPKKEIFEQKLSILKKEIARIPAPEDLATILKRHQVFLFNEKAYKKEKDLWQALLNFWLEEIRARIWRDGFDPQIMDFSPALIFFIGGAKNLFIGGNVISLESYFDPEMKEVVIKNPKNSTAKLEPKLLKRIDQIILEGNRKLFLPQVCKFLVIDEKLYLTELRPFTQTLPVSQNIDVVIPKNTQQKLIKSAIKVFFNLSSGFAVGSNFDGILIESNSEKNYDDQIFKLAEAALSFPEKPVIFKLPDNPENDVRGSLKLIHNQKSLDLATSIFLFARNKKNLLNVELAIPLTRSIEEFLQIKRELAARNISRKGALKFWLEMLVPENLLNLERYLDAGFDGAILDLDHLQKCVGGHSEVEREFYKREIEALIILLRPIFKKLHQAKIPILARGEVSIYPEMLDFLIESGVWGVVANTPIEADSLPEHLNWSERRMMVKRLNPA